MLKSLARRNETPLAAWRNEMNHFFDRFNHELSDFPNLDMQNFSPKVEIKETKNEYVVKAEMPGLTEKDIQVSLKDNSLILEGEKKSEVEKEGKGRYFSEFSYGSFYRSIPFDYELKDEEVKATYKNGILTVKLAKLENGKNGSKAIPILLA